jgi:hypothetical protein
MNIFGFGKTIEKGFDLIDSMYDSKSELIEAGSDAEVKLITARSAAKAKLMDSYSHFKVAQRYLAFLFCGTYMVTFLVATVLLGRAGELDFKSFIELVNAFYLGPIVLTIVGFYFGGGMLEGAINSRKKS